MMSVVDQDCASFALAMRLLAEDKELQVEEERKEVLEKQEARRKRRAVGRRIPAGLAAACRGGDKSLGRNMGLEQPGAGGRDRRGRRREDRKEASQGSVRQKEMERVEVKVEKWSDRRIIQMRREIKCEVKVNVKEVEGQVKDESAAHLREVEGEVESMERVERAPALALESHPPGRKRLMSSRSALMEDSPGRAASLFSTTLPGFEEAHGAKDAKVGKKPVRKVKKAKTTNYLWGAVRR